MDRQGSEEGMVGRYQSPVHAANSLPERKASGKGDCHAAFGGMFAR
jgi:hypothetical protein